jgi:hypothetical protein
VFEFSLSNPSAEDTTYLYIHQWNCWKCWLHYHFANSNCTCGCYYGNCFCTNNCWYYCRINETFTIASGTASATGTINDNDAPTVAWSLLLRLLKEVLLCLNSAWATLWGYNVYLYIHQWNCWKCWLHYLRKQ